MGLSEDCSISQFMKMVWIEKYDINELLSENRDHPRHGKIK